MRTSSRLALALVLALAAPGIAPASDPAPPGTKPSSGDEIPAGYGRYLELRVYSTKENKRDPFLDYFEKYYLESQEEVGMRIWGQFGDLDEANHFVWLRGYRSMDERATGLMRFYTGELWNRTGQQVRDMLARMGETDSPATDVAAE